MCWHAASSSSSLLIFSTSPPQDGIASRTMQQLQHLSEPSDVFCVDNNQSCSTKAAKQRGRDGDKQKQAASVTNKIRTLWQLLVIKFSIFLCIASTTQGREGGASFMAKLTSILYLGCLRLVGGGGRGGGCILFGTLHVCYQKQATTGTFWLGCRKEPSGMRASREREREPSASCLIDWMLGWLGPADRPTVTFRRSLDSRQNISTAVPSLPSCQEGKAVISVSWVEAQRFTQK